MSALKGIAIVAIIAAATGLSIFLSVHHSLMPSSAQLSQIAAAALAAAPLGSTVHRLRAPDQIESDGHAKVGYFTYEVTGKASPERYRADWRIADDKVELTSFKRL